MKKKDVIDTSMMNEDNWRVSDMVADFKSDDLYKDIDSPFLAFNAYFNHVEGLIAKSDREQLNQTAVATLGAATDSVLHANIMFRFQTSLQAYCDFVQLLTKDKISAVALYETLISELIEFVVRTDLAGLIKSNIMEPAGAFNFAISVGSCMYNGIIDFLYRYNIRLTESLYADLAAANVTYCEVITNDLIVLTGDYNKYYKPFELSFDE